MNRNTKILLVIIAIVVFLYFRGKKHPTYPTGVEIDPSSEDDGYDAGYIDGYNEGYDEGNDDGYNEGYDEGNDDGYNEGYDEGNEDGYNEGYDEGNEDSGFGESPIQPPFDPDDDPSNVRTDNWSDPRFPVDPDQLSRRAASMTSIANPYSKGRIGSVSVGTLQNKARIGSVSVGTLQNKAGRGSGSTGTLQNKNRRNRTTQTGWTFATMLERIFS